MNQNTIESIEWHKNQLSKLLSDEGTFYKIEIELDAVLEKAERGQRTEMRTVKRGGKTFQRKTRVGVKDKPKTNKVKKPLIEGLKEGSYVDMGDKGEQIVYGIANDKFLSEEGEWYYIKDILSISNQKEIPKETFKPSNEYFNELKKTDRGMNKIRCLYTYTGTGYGRLNSYLMNNIVPPYTTKDELDTEIKKLGEIIDEAPKYEGKVFRGMRFENKEEFDKFLLQCKSGGELIMKNFISTSTEEHVADYFSTSSPGSYAVSFVIKSKKGIFLNGASSNESEKEVLFNNNSKFKISNIKKISDNKFEITMEEI